MWNYSLRIFRYMGKTILLLLIITLELSEKDASYEQLLGTPGKLKTMIFIYKQQ